MLHRSLLSEFGSCVTGKTGDFGSCVTGSLLTEFGSCYREDC